MNRAITNRHRNIKLPQHNLTAPLERLVPANLLRAKPLCSIIRRKPLRTFCFAQNTHGAGVVMLAHQRIVAAEKISCAHLAQIKKVYGSFFIKSG